MIAELEAARSLVANARDKAKGNEQDVAVLDALNQLAHVHHRASDLDSELAVLTDLAPKAAAAFGDAHPNTLMVLARRFSCVRHNNAEEARVGLVELQPKFVKVFGADHEATMTLNHTLASVYHILEDHESERSLLTAQLETLRKALKETDEPVKATVMCLSRVLGYLDDAAGNRALLQGHYDAVEPVLGKDNSHVLLVASGLALAMAVEEDFTAELAMRQAVQPSMVKLFGPHDMNVLMSEAHIAVAELYSLIPADHRAKLLAERNKPFDATPTETAAADSSKPAAAVAVPPQALSAVDRFNAAVAPLESTIGANHAETINLLLRCADAMASFPGLEQRGRELFEVIDARVRSRGGDSPVGAGMP